MKNRLLEMLAMTIIGDSLLCVMSPRRHLSLWNSGPGWWTRMWGPFIRHAGWTRVLGGLGVVFGVWLATRQQPEVASRLTRGRSVSGRLARALR